MEQKYSWQDTCILEVIWNIQTKGQLYQNIWTRGDEKAMNIETKSQWTSPEGKGVHGTGLQIITEAP